MFEKILNWLKPKKIKKFTPLKTLRDVDFFDTVWVQDTQGQIYEGWVFDKTKKHIIVSALIETGDIEDYRFILKHSLNSTTIDNGSRILYFNDPCLKDK